MVQKATFKTQSVVPLECISSTERKLFRIKGVRGAAIDGRSNEFVVTYDSPEASADAIQAALDECDFRLVESTEARNERP